MYPLSAVIYLLALAFTLIVLGIRVLLVYEYRTTLIEKIAQRAEEDILFDRNYQWRWEAYNSIGSTEMICKFWRTFKSFYPDTSFLE